MGIFSQEPLTLLIVPNNVIHHTNNGHQQNEQLAEGVETGFQTF
jgi:hypothetical protein